MLFRSGSFLIHAVTALPPKLIVIDYLSWIKNEPGAERNDLAIGVTMKRLAQIAKDLHCCVLLLAQLNRDSVKDGKPRRPTMADFRDSGCIEQDSDQILLLWEPPSPDGTEDNPREKETTVEFIVEKNRHGPKGRVRIDWKKALTQYRESPWLNSRR